MKKRGEIILYQPDSEVRLEVRLEEETVWLNRQQLSELFNRDVKTIGKHVNNTLKEELAGMATVANFATVQKEGDRIVTRQVEYYNLDMVLSVGYRVKSNRGIEFRRWANKVLKEYLLKGHAINYRLEQMDTRLQKHERQIEYLTDKVDFFVRTSLPPMEGVFYDGQIFDAYKFATDLIRRQLRGRVGALDAQQTQCRCESRHLHAGCQPPVAAGHPGHSHHRPAVSSCFYGSGNAVRRLDYRWL